MYLFSVDVCNIINEDRMFVNMPLGKHIVIVPSHPVYIYTVERILAATKFSIYRSLSVYLLIDGVGLQLGLLELFQNTVQEEFL